MRSINAILICANECSRLSLLLEFVARCGEFLLRGIYYNTAAEISRAALVSAARWAPGNLDTENAEKRGGRGQFQPDHRTLAPGGELCYSEPSIRAVFYRARMRIVGA